MDEPLLAEAHKRLPPANLYYPVDDEASRQGRWQAQAEEALEECGHAYFLPASDPMRAEADADHVNNTPKVEQSQIGIGIHSNVHVSCSNDALMINVDQTASHSAARARIGRPRAGRPIKPGGPGPSLTRKATAKKEALEQSHGLRSELQRAIRTAQTTLKKGDRIESRWRRPTRLDKPRVDPGAWHPGRLIAVHRDGNIDMVFEDGEEERLSGIPAKHVRLAPSSEPSNYSDATTADTHRIGPSPPIDLCSASRRELAHIASVVTSLRRAWENPVTMDQELVRLRALWEEKMRTRPEWRGTFPVVNFSATKTLSIGGGMARAVAQSRPETWPRRQAQDTQESTRQCRRRSRRSLAMLGAAGQLEATKRSEQRPRTFRNDCTPGSTREIASSPALVETQSNLVKAAVAYDKCVADVRRCLDRGASAFCVAQTYSEQQSAFEEVTANLGPALPARAGYTDWRGSPVVGLQNATLDVVEAIDAWAAEWTAVRNEAASCVDHRGSSQGGVEETRIAVEVPPFLWEGLPLVRTIIGHSGKLLARSPELKGWYGAGFPVEWNPFFLAYPIDDRPVTPRSAHVRAFVNGEVGGWWARFVSRLQKRVVYCRICTEQRLVESALFLESFCVGTQT